jgi:CRISPR-associated protein Cmr6
MDLIALVPKAVGEDFNDAPPGHRYRLYLKFWNNIDFSPTGNAKLAALRQVCTLPEHSKKLMKALAERSKAPDSETTLSIPAVSISPFATGLGWEHPNENGFAFLDPYGLPYLPGSGVKGVLRQAARELAEGEFGDTGGWTKPVIIALFGSDDTDNPSQGALRFWDVIPVLAGDKLEVDILNPHYGEYYRGNSTPHDAGQPVPVFFLTVPPKSHFYFRVDLIAPSRLSEDLRKDWKDLLQAAFEHAFDWLGFGAKTAVGYGAMKSQIVAPKKVTATVEEIWENATVKYDVSGRVMTAILGEKKATKVEAKALYDELGSKKRQDKAKSGELKANIKILTQDGKPELLEILPPPA